MRIIASLICFVLAFGSAPLAQDAEVRIQLVPVLSGLTNPLYLTSARDGSNRLFIVEQPGRIKVLQPGATSPTVFLDITDKVLSGGERGLLGLAFHPQFSTNGRFFVNYTRRPDGATVIAEYRVSASNPDLADGQEKVILIIPQPFPNHNGGMVEFGPDGFLYIGMGDGGSANDPGNRAQNLQELLGKILRIDVDRADGSQPYSSPVDNPFFGSIPGRDEIYALGFRNPWRFSFDRATGQLYVGDVGQNAIEEVDVVVRGGNYGWRVFEGSRCTNLGPAPCDRSNYIFPIVEYSHGGGRCSVTGGYVYRGSRNSLPVGSYVYGDFCSGEIFLFRDGASQVLLDTDINIASFGEDESGEIYVVGLGGTVHRIANPDQPPPPSALRLDSALVRRRSNGAILDPVTVRPNGKKFEVVARGAGFAEGAIVLVNGAEMNTQPGSPADQELVARLRRDTLSQPGSLIVQVRNPDGSLSNQIQIQVLP